MNSFTQSSPALTKSAALLSLLVIALAVTSLFSLSFTNQRSDDMLKHLDQFHAAEISAIEIRANFKTQVQEWKNLLLRGADPDSFQKYKKQFKQQAEAVQKELSELQSQLEALDEDSSITRSLTKEHQALQKVYIEALSHYIPADPASAFKVDAAVRGADRPLTSQIELLAKSMYQKAQTQHQVAQQNANKRYDRLRQITTVVAALTVLASFALVFFVNRQQRS